MTNPVTPTPISPLPEAPSRTQDPADFIPTADAFVGGMQPFGEQNNTVANQTFQNATCAVENAQASVTARNEAQAAASSARGAANFVGIWSTLTGNAVAGITVEHQGLIWLLLVNVSDITQSEPSSSNSDWRVQSGITYVTPATGSTLSTTLPNLLTSNGAFNYPAASSVQNGTPIVILVLEANRGITPQINLVAGDNVTDGRTTQTDNVRYPANFSNTDICVSDGVNTWRF